jgi:lipoate-protein ligase A
MASSQNSAEVWRFIDSGFQNGRRNMAIDEAIAISATSGQGIATLRIYGWRPPAISLGYHQSIKDINLSLCEEDGIDVVFRPTGGRAILHAEELTYAVILPAGSNHYRKDVLPVYDLISRALLAALQLIGIDASFDRASLTPKDFMRGDLSTLCYATSVQHEIGFGGRKLVGSAQRRFEGSLLQHGSILIGQRHLDITRYLTRGDERWRRAVNRYMRDHTICLNELSPTPIIFPQLSLALRKGFEQVLGVTFQEGELSENELRSVDEILSKA